MNKKEHTLRLFEKMNPDFFKKDNIRQLPENEVFTELILALGSFEPDKICSRLDPDVTFGVYDGELAKLQNAVKKVEPGWVKYFDGQSRVFCGYVGGNIASFCIADAMCEYDLDGRTIRVGGPGCVGTLPEYRRKGIGSAVVAKTTGLLQDEGFDYSYIHYTHIARWYEKIGYKPVIEWNCHGVLEYEEI